MTGIETEGFAMRCPPIKNITNNKRFEETIISILYGWCFKKQTISFWPTSTWNNTNGWISFSGNFRTSLVLGWLAKACRFKFLRGFSKKKKHQGPHHESVFVTGDNFGIFWTSMSFCEVLMEGRLVTSSGWSNFYLLLLWILPKVCFFCWGHFDKGRTFFPKKTTPMTWL